MKSSSFRRWVEEIWRENQSECFAWRESPTTLDVYFNRYKWWLKREYRYRQSVQNA